MPLVRIDMFPGRTIDDKRAIAKAVTDAFVAAADIDPETVRIIFNDVPQENWAVAGQLAPDRLAAAQQKK